MRKDIGSVDVAPFLIRVVPSDSIYLTLCTVEVQWYSQTQTHGESLPESFFGLGLSR